MRLRCVFKCYFLIDSFVIALVIIIGLHYVCVRTVTVHSTDHIQRTKRIKSAIVVGANIKLICALKSPMWIVPLNVFEL